MIVLASNTNGGAKSSKSAGKSSGKKPRNSNSAAKTRKSDIKYVGNDRRKTKTADWSGNRQYIYSIAFFAASVLMGCIAFINGENLWAKLRGLFFSFIGIGFFFFTIYMFAAAITVTVKRISKTPMWLILAGFTLTILFVSLIHILTADTALSFSEQFKSAVSSGWASGSGAVRLTGGVVGGLFGGCFLAAFGKAPAIAITMILIFANVLVIGVIALNLMGKTVRETLSATDERRKERSEQRKAEKEAELKVIQQQKQEMLRLEHERQQEQKRIAREADRKQREQKIFSYNELTEDEINELINSDNGSAAEEPPKKDAPEKAEKKSVRDIFSMGVRTQQDEEKVDDIGPAETEEPVLPPDKVSDETAALVLDAASEARQKSEQTKAAVESYIDEKTRNRKTYVKPPIECLAPPKFNTKDDCAAEMKTTSKKLVDTLKSFNVETELVGVCRGPSVTRYELQPAPGVKISKITNLSDDIALNLAASGVRIEAPIPNKSAVGIEVPNKIRSTVTLREIIISPEFRSASSKINVALGKDITGNVNCADLAKMPHLLIAGTTGSGKSVCLNCMIASILYNAKPDEVKMILIDPKQVEFSVYDGIPHLLVPVISNPRKAAGALAWAVGEMENRYKAFSECGVRDIKGFNKYCQTHTELAPMPLIVIFIDELNDLMMISPKEVEDSVCRLAQKARAAGMHLVVATQRPSVDVITGIIKANIPSRISLSVSSQVDSRTILDCIGAEKLLGNGDMLYNPVGMSKPVRIQGAYLSDEEVEDIVDFIKQQETGEYDQEIMDEIERQATVENKKKGAGASAGSDEPEDEMFTAAIDAVVNAQVASTTFLQKKLKLGYARASRIMDELHEKGYVGPQEGSKPRKVLITPQQWMEIKMSLDSPSSDDDA